MLLALESLAAVVRFWRCSHVKMTRASAISYMQREDTSKPALLKSSLGRAQCGAAFRAQLGPVFFLAVIFLLNFVSRIILSPLLPTIEKELAISHSQAGFFFFLTSGGYLVGLFSSGLLASRSTHRLAIVISGRGRRHCDVDGRLGAKSMA